MDNKLKVLVAGVGGASLGTEILKSLAESNNYTLYACDISHYAYGLFEAWVEKGYVVKPNKYIENISEICEAHGISFVIPGGEQPMVLLNNSREQLSRKGIIIISNNQYTIDTFSDKHRTFELLDSLGITIPITVNPKTEKDFDEFPYPCIVKPSTGSGGSSFVFIAADKEEAKLYANLLICNNKQPILQEYIDDSEGEFTVGVLSLPNRHVVGSIALKRLFHSKLAVTYKGDNGLISSGYTQGQIDDYPEIRKVAEKIAIASGSEGPLNIQGRVKNGVFVPFEINPRFSASTYLRTLAGFNEIDIFIQYLYTGEIVTTRQPRFGVALRSFTERFIEKGEHKND